jgi:hypothetical protein
MNAPTKDVTSVQTCEKAPVADQASRRPMCTQVCVHLYVSATYATLHGANETRCQRSGTGTRTSTSEYHNVVMPSQL